MNAAIALLEDDALETLFAPIPESAVAALLAEYAVDKDRVEQVASVFSGELLSVVSYFIEGNNDDRYSSTTAAERLFRLDGALAALNASYWGRALALTDVLDCMPQARRNTWHESIHERKTPPFDTATVLATLRDMLGSRRKFFAERVDGIFRALSGEHVTNSPAGFRKRMILNYVLSMGYADHTKAGVINDLRCVIAMLSGREAPGHNATTPIVNDARNFFVGQWVEIDGGALRLKVYKKGTAHLEVHPDIAHKLNCVLASIYPRAVASGLRKRPAKKKLKDFVMLRRPIPPSVLKVLHEIRPRHGEQYVTITAMARHDNDKRVLAEVARVLESIGGVRKDSTSPYRFDYSPAAALAEIFASGCLPDEVAHQYYPTPPDIAARAVALADIGPGHTCLEPSAGQGAIACLLPKERTVCVEISKLHCEVLRGRGCESVCEADFLEAQPGGFPFDRVVMNPPFSDGRWQAHLEHAAGMLAEGGKLVAVLPASARGKNVLPGWSLTWTEVISNEFAGTSVSVVIMTAERAR